MSQENSPTAVLFVITKSNFGGAQRYVFDLATGLPSEHFSVAVACGGTGERGAAQGTLDTRLKDAGIRVLPIRHFMRDIALVDDFLAFYELYRLIRTERPDVLHVTSSKAGGLGALAGRLARIPHIVFTTHGLPHDESWRGPLSRVALKLLTWMTVLLAHTTICVSRDSYERLRSVPLLARRVVYVPNGIECPTFLPRDEARKTLAAHAPTLPVGAPWIGTIAELHPNKHLDLIIRALAHPELHEAHVLVIGEGEERAPLQKLAVELGLANRVHLVGYLRDASTLLQALDVFTLTSRKEGLPYVLIEAGFAALPVVATDIPGARDIVTHGVSGVLVKDDPHILAEALLRFLRPSADTTRMQQALHADVVQRFSRSSMLRATREHYRR